MNRMRRGARNYTKAICVSHYHIVVPIEIFMASRIRSYRRTAAVRDPQGCIHWLIFTGSRPGA
jgi:hypothetical protein